MRFLLLGPFLGLLLLESTTTSLLVANEESPVPPPLRPDTRLELGTKLLEFERRLFHELPAEEELQEIDRGFDAATLAFFAGSGDAALLELDALIARLPSVEGADVTYASTWTNLDLDLLHAECDALETRLEAAIVKMPDLVDLADIAFSRVHKLRAQTPGDTLRLVEPFERFRSEVASEVATISRGKDPYVNRSGNSWRAFSRKQVWRADDRSNDSVPYRIVVPSDPQAGESFPLVVAFHGAGGDENMFAFAYGAGLLAKLAESRRFVLVTPRTYALVWKPELLRPLLLRAMREAPIDTRRVYSIGHSLGATPALSIGDEAGVTIAATAIFAGTPRPAKSQRPTILFAGKNDRVISFSLIERAAKALGSNLTFRPIEGRGHTILVGEYLEEAVDFLLKHTAPEDETK